MIDEPELEYLMMKCKVHGEQKAIPIEGSIVCEACLKNLKVYRKQNKEKEMIEKFKRGF